MSFNAFFRSVAPHLWYFSGLQHMSELEIARRFVDTCKDKWVLLLLGLLGGGMSGCWGGQGRGFQVLRAKTGGSCRVMGFPVLEGGSGGTGGFHEL